MSDRKRLMTILATMDIPVGRTDLSKPENVRWLLRNLGIRNHKHPGFEEAVRLLKVEA
jgi:hypothetical protein